MSRGSLSCVRFLLTSFCLIFVIFGALLIYTGVSTFVSLHKYELVVHNGPDNATIALLVIGCAIFLTAFLGCCGSMTGNDCMLRTFSFILTVLLIFELISVGFVYAFKDKIHQTMETGFEEAVVKFNRTDSNSALSILVDDVQSHFKCCGANGPYDWRNNTFFPNDELPLSCCKKDMNNTVCSTLTMSHYTDGCVNIISDELRSSVNFLSTIGIIIIIVQIIGIMFSCSIVCQRKQYAYI